MAPDLSEKGQLVFKAVKIKKNKKKWHIFFQKISKFHEKWDRGMWKTMPGESSHIKEQSERAPQKSWCLV